MRRLRFYLIAFIWVACAVIASELLCRLYMHYVGFDSMKISILENGDIWWESLPNQDHIRRMSLLSQSNEADFWIKTNSHGFRDDAFRTEENSSFKIFSLGDSETWGFGVEREETYSDLLESRLVAGGNNVDVMNFGVQGFDTHRIQLQLGKYASVYEPDALVILMNSNDWGPSYCLGHRLPGEFRFYTLVLAQLAKELFYVAIGQPEGDWTNSINALNRMSNEIDIPVFILLYYELPSAVMNVLVEWEKSSKDVVIVDCIKDLERPIFHLERGGHLSAEGHLMVSDRLYQSMMGSGIFNGISGVAD
jgi:lysophospholipase L1-like esterase